MKKLFSILLVSLLCALTASAEGPHRIRVKVLPEGAVKFTIHYQGDVDERGRSVDRFSSDTLAVFEDVAEPGTRIEIYCNPPTGYVEKSWTQNGLPIETGSYSTFYYTMPDEDVELVGIYEYDPGAPTYQPGAGNWDPETGTLICDNGEGSYPAGFNYSEDAEKVVTYIVGGMDGGYSRQYSLYSKYPNMVTLDLSRTTINKLYISGEREALKEVILPSTFNEFGQNAMKPVKLQTLTCFAVTPPKLYIYREYDWDTGQYIDKEQRVFYDCPDMVVRVPRESVPLYQAAFGWNEFTILPVDQNYVNLTVRMMDDPKAETLEKYKNMTLLLTNLGTGQVRRLLMNGRNEYEFRYLPQGSNYSLSLQNERGFEAAHADNIFLGDENVLTTLSDLKTPRTLTMDFTAEGKHVGTNDVSTTWFTAARKYIARGSSLDGVFDGQKLYCVTALNAELAREYHQPDTMLVTVGEPYDITVPLEKLKLQNATFTVVDSLTMMGIEGAVVQVAQMLPDGQTGTISTLTTTRSGVASGEVLAAPSMVTVTSPMHGSKSVYADLAKEASMTVHFLPAKGTSVKLNHTYRAAVPQGVEAQTEPAYAEARSLDYSFTATLPDGRDSIITHYLTNYPIYTFYTELVKGTRIRVAASSATGKISPVETEAVVGEGGTVEITLPIVERGYIEAVYERSESRKPAMLVFDAQTGALVKRQDWGGFLTTRVSGLPEGEYVVVAMSQGPQYQAIGSIQQLEAYEEGSDYVKETVGVSDGQASSVKFTTVPITMTQLATNLTERKAGWGKSMVTEGADVGIAVRVAFEGLQDRFFGQNAEEDYPTNCRLELYMPEGFRKFGAYCTERYYNEDPIYKGGVKSTGYCYKSATAQWDEEQRKLTIDWPHPEEGGKMNINAIATKSGTFTPEAYLVYTLHGKEYTEVLETTSLLVNSATINVADLIINPTFVVSGTALYFPPSVIYTGSGSTIYNEYVMQQHRYVTIMDGDQPLGKVKVETNGEWRTRVSLVNPTALSKHEIWAKMEYPNGVTTQTDAHVVTYDPNGVVPLSTKMSFFNHHPVHLESTEIVFDYVNDRCYPSSYGYSNQEGYNTDFTFEINLSTNDTTKVYACAVYINTEGPDAEERVVMAHYNARKDRWIAYSKFNTRTMPYNVVVQPYYYEDVVGSRDEQDKAFDFYNIMRAGDSELDPLLAKANPLVAQLQAAVDRGEVTDVTELRELQRQINTLLGAVDSMDTTEPIDDDAAAAQFNALMEQYPELWSFSDQLKEAFSKSFNELGEIAKGITFESAEGLTAETLAKDGYEHYNLDDGSSIYYIFREDGTVVFVDLANNLKVSMSQESVDYARGIAPKAVGDFLKKTAEKLWDIVNTIITWTDRAGAMFSAMEKSLQGTLQVCRAAIQAERAANPGALLPTLREAMYLCRQGLAQDGLKAVRLTLKGLNYLTKASFYLGVINFAKDALTYGYKIYQAEELYHYMNNYFNDHPECDDQGLRARASGLASGTEVKVAAILSAGATSLYVSHLSVVGLTNPASAPPALAVFGATLASTLASLYGAEVLMEDFKHEYNYLQNRYSQITRLCDMKMRCEQTGDCPTCKQKGTCPDWPKRPKEPKTPKTTPTLDPSGFVYEGIESNRLEGVTTTVFYKKVDKNIFGDDEEIVYVWDAENYDQVNPQITDENGEYGWMVPNGMWQVKYEKQGYQTEYSNWLPVPPPQLDVNQAMTQYSEPQVAGVKASTKAVSISFDKYMLADSLNTSNIFVSQGGKQVEGTINVQLADTLGMPIVNRVTVVPKTELPAGGTMTLTVRRNVTSYAGVQMNQDFTQDFDITASVEQLVSDSALHVVYDEQMPLVLQALPAAVAAGKKVCVKVLGDMIATADVTELTLDEEGKGIVNITGEAHGTTAVVMSLKDDSSIQTMTVINVKDEMDFICPMPTTDYQPGQAYSEGTQITLSCELPEATIYYTTDSTCPCNSSTAKLYVEPITIEGGSLMLKAYAVAPGYMDSEIAEYNFYTTGIITPTAERAPVTGTYNMLGQKMNDTDHLSKGVYIINGKKVVVQ